MNSREVNESLILGSLSKEMQDAIALLELADPGLPCLSPLAKAAWQLHSSKSVSREVAEAALDSTFLIASDLGGDLLRGDHICTFECEKVVHTITVDSVSKSGERVIALSFSSEGAAQCLMGGEAPLTPFLSMNEIGLHKSGSDQLSETQIFDAYESLAIPAAPAVYPCDTDFIGILTYRLVRVDAQQVSGPCFTDSFNDFSCDDPGLLAEWTEGSEFCWLHQLTREQAEALGLARREGCHGDASMPDWLRDDLSLSKIWIASEDLKESYDQGTVTGYSLEDILLCLGAGPEWQPGDWSSGVDEVDRGLDDYPNNQMPLKIMHLRKTSPCDDSDLGVILQLLGNLVSACADPEV